MFRNLYFQSARFRDYNWTDCLHRVVPVSADHLLEDIRQAYDQGEAPDPCFVDTIRLTLRLETAARYLERVEAPLELRDFALSKLFQFVYEPLCIQSGLDKPDRRPLRRQLELWLDALPKTALAQLYRFDWLSFFADSHRWDRSELLARLDLYLPALRRQGRRAVWMGRRGPVPDLASYKPIRDAVEIIGEGWEPEAGAAAAGPAARRGRASCTCKVGRD